MTEGVGDVDGGGVRNARLKHPLQREGMIELARCNPGVPGVAAGDGIPDNVKSSPS